MDVHVDRAPVVLPLGARRAYRARDQLRRHECFWHERSDFGLSGTGLGLAIASGIVEAHGGSIGTESEEARGSTLRFTIPADARPSPDCR